MDKTILSQVFEKRGQLTEIVTDFLKENIPVKGCNQEAAVYMTMLFAMIHDGLEVLRNLLDPTTYSLLIAAGMSLIECELEGGAAD